MKIEFNEYKLYLIDKRNVSVNTCNAYISDINQFIEYISKDKTYEKITECDIEKYICEMQNMGKANSSIIRIVASLKSFYEYLFISGKIQYNPAKNLIVKKTIKIPQILNEQEIKLLLDSPDISTTKGCRDKAMLELLYSTGIKVSELINLNIEDVNFDLGILFVNSSKNDRNIPVKNEVIMILKQYVDNVRKNMVLSSNEKALFVNINGFRLSRQGFWKIIKKYSVLSNIKKEITPQTLRHSCAVHMLENGIQPKKLKEIMGHSDISSTLFYSQLLNQQ